MVVLTSGLIALTSGMAGKRPGLAGFLLALPLSSMIALILNYTEYRDPEKASAFARSIFVAVPLSLTFFLPFFFADRLKLRFEFLFLAGIAFLALSYGVHRLLVRD